MAETMDYRPIDVRGQVLERVFPDLRFGGDPDIERYFEMRAAGRMLDALAVYTSRLKPRYPDDEKRITLLRLYRTHSPAFSEFLHGILMERADELVARICRTIDQLTAPLSGVSMRDTYAVLKAVERVARLLPDDVDEARKAAWAYADFAKLLDHKRAEADKVAYLLGEFYDQAMVDIDTPADFISASLSTEEARQERETEEQKKNFFDLSKINFDESDIRRIEIPSGLDRDEDKVLAYCHKYWLRSEDPGFERIVWLYSKKYEARHYEVFKAIKIGRRKKYQDDDILSMVASAIATRYSYTVQGDLYMQNTWRIIKSNLYGQAVATRNLERSAIPAPAKPVHRFTAQKKMPGATVKIAPAAKASPLKATPIKAVRMAAAPVPRAKRHDTLPKLVRTRAGIIRNRGNAGAAVASALKASGSISDRIKRLSGRAYDVYKEIFLSGVRGHIRTALLRNRQKSGGTFGDAANDAENIVHDFMERNYSNAYMNWTDSEHRARVGTLGFDLESLDDIIESCYRKIAKR